MERGAFPGERRRHVHPAPGRDQPPGQLRRPCRWHRGQAATGKVLSSPAPTCNESVSVLLFLEREKKRMPPGEVDALEVGDDSLDDERKIPLKLMRRGDRGGDSW